MRLFIAIELSPEIRDALAHVQSHLKYASADVKWVEKDNIHLTLKFLGEVSERKAEEVKISLDAVAGEARSFDILIKDIGAFPKIDYPRVIWVGLDKGAKESTQLAARIDEELSKIGFQKETRPFATHLTIGRVRSAKNKEALRDKISALCRAGFNPPYTAAKSQLISSVTLFQSTLTPKGPIYTKLHESCLSA